uniref:AC transposase n=1 Tax=Cajanus cajan TaxID=3821 RepID=A0A151S1W0_CAJCA|nr:Putative AC transposase [Cajanus cajan]
MRCCAHFLNLIMKEGFKDNIDAILRICGAVKYIMYSLWKKKYDKYWGNAGHLNMFLLIAFVLHPRYKLQFIHWLINQNFDGEVAFSLKEKVESSLKLLFQEYNGVEVNTIFFQRTNPNQYLYNGLSEVAFSIGGRVLDPYYNSLTPIMVEALICTQDWLKRTILPLFANENGDFEELEKFEQSNKLDLFYNTLLYYILVII